MQLDFKKSIYPIEIILKAAYVFTDYAYIYIDENDDSYLIDFEVKDENNSRNIQGEFKNELLAQLIRKSISERTGNVREVIFQRALSSSMLMEDNTSGLNEKKDNDVNLDDVLVDWFDGRS